MVQSIELLVQGRQINVKKENITRVSLEQMKKIKGKTDWDRVDKMTDEEIEQNALDDPDNQPIPDEMWDDAKVIFPKKQVNF